MPFNKGLGMDLPLGYGINGMIENFPYELPGLLSQAYGNQALERHAREWLSKYDFTRPSED